MRRWRSHPLIGLLCALCLLGAQQAAHAHFIGHLDAPGKATAFQASGGAEDVSAVDGICVTCAAFAALSSAPPSQASVPAATPAPHDRPAAPVCVFMPAASAPPYASRAPPRVP